MELLVVIAIIALLIAILLPALGKARQTARYIVNQAQHRTLASSQAAFAFDHDDQYASINSTNIEYTIPQGFGGKWAWLTDKSKQTPTMPMSTFDWISPILGDELRLSPNRATKTAQLFNDFADPAARAFSTLVWGTAVDKSEFEAIRMNGRGFRQISYLSPEMFHAVAPGHHHPAPGHPQGRWALWRAPGEGLQVEAARGFRPRLDLVGQHSAKVVSMDGTRYFENGVLDFDVSPVPTNFGCFVGNYFWRHSTAYGREKHLLKPADRWKFSIRHMNNTRITLGYFDGHAGGLTREEFYANPNPFAPRGTRVLDHAELTPEARDWILERDGFEDDGAYVVH